MLFSGVSSYAAAALIAAGLVNALPSDFNRQYKHDKRSTVVEDGTTYSVFEHAESGGVMQYVTNSGICETTAGVNQYSGYFSVGNNMNMWFWFFEARDSPNTAPLSTWFNGGPGCSSMIGLFQENGPCQFYNGADTPSINQYSFNSYANMLYIDQPIGVGFSYGTDSVDSTESAAPYVYKLLQAFYAAFPQYKNRDFGIFTESYGGHYGPEFASYVQNQTAESNTAGINLKALGINNGWYDGILQYEAYITYSLNNSYGPLISQSDYSNYMQSYENDCLPALQQCPSVGDTSNNRQCANAQNTCGNEIESAIQQGANFDVYDVREPSNDPYPPPQYTDYLAQPSVTSAIGAKATYTECPDQPYQQFANTGDDSRSTLDLLSEVVRSGIEVILWHGDADWICNWFGGQAVANAVQFAGSSQFQAASLQPYTVNGNHSADYKTVDNFSFMRVFQAGHEVPYYQPQTALQVFTQILSGSGLKST